MDYGYSKTRIGLGQTFKTFEDAVKNTKLAISKYNTVRLHLSCGYLTPQQAHNKGQGLENVWRKKLSTFPQKEERIKEAKKEIRKTTTTKTVKYI